MTMVRARIAMSLDGYVAGPNQRLEEPLGDGGERLHEWAFASRTWQEQHGRDVGDAPRTPDDDVLARSVEDVGAYVMGRNMFGGGPGPWDASWRGWWGEEPPYHVPVFVLTHHAREPLEMAGGTTFHFVTEGLDAALTQARAAAGDQDVMVAGGGSTIRQFLAAGLLDELQLHVTPVVLGGGVRLLDGAGDAVLEQVEVIGGNGVAHLRYRVGTAGG